MLTREYMADADFWRKHDAETREFYMLLALFTDDAGWLEWDPDYLLFAIYRYEDSRLAEFTAGVDSLRNAGRLKILKCGHAFMPKVAKRPRPGEHEYRVKKDHERRCQSTGRRSRVDSGRLDTPDQTRPIPNPDHYQRKTSSTPRSRSGARGGVPETAGAILGDLKRRVGWEPPAQ